ncbi:MAG: hypothetical protein AAGM36_02430 [Cyanobacteria bacterium J06597_1]
MPIRYSFWTDRPRNVRHRDYQNYLGLRFGTVVLGGIGLCILVMSVFGVTLKASSELAALPGLSISDALSWDGNSNNPVKIEGFLLASNPYTMPDDDSLQVIRGGLLVVARGDRDADERVREELFRWERAANHVTLSDGSSTIPLAFNLDILPLVEDRSARGRVLWAGDARRSQPLDVEYEAQIFPLTPTIWNGVESVFVDVTRRYLVQGEWVTIVAGLDTSSGQAQLVDPLGNRLQVYRGSEADILQTNQQARRSMGIVAILMLGGSYLLFRKAGEMYYQFEILSNQ